MTADLLSPRAQGAKDEPSPPISIVVAVAVRLYRDGLARMLGEHRHLRLAGTSATAAEAEAAVLALRPDAVVIDVTVGDVSSQMRTLRAERLDTRIPAFAVQEEVWSILTYAEAGADGFVTANVR